MNLPRPCWTGYEKKLQPEKNTKLEKVTTLSTCNFPKWFFALAFEPNSCLRFVRKWCGIPWKLLSERYTSERVIILRDNLPCRYVSLYGIISAILMRLVSELHTRTCLVSNSTYVFYGPIVLLHSLTCTFKVIKLHLLIQIRHWVFTLDSAVNVKKFFWSLKISGIRQRTVKLHVKRKKRKKNPVPSSITYSV